MSKILIGAIIIMTLIGGGYYYYTDKKLTAAAAQIGSLKVSNDIQKKSIDTLQENNARLQQLSLELEERLQAAEEINTNLRGKLSRHNLTSLSRKKPGLIETRVNKGTTDVLQKLRDITSK